MSNAERHHIIVVATNGDLELNLFEISTYLTKQRDGSWGADLQYIWDNYVSITRDFENIDYSHFQPIWMIKGKLDVIEDIGEHD